MTKKASTKTSKAPVNLEEEQGPTRGAASIFGIASDSLGLNSEVLASVLDMFLSEADSGVVASGLTLDLSGTPRGWFASNWFAPPTSRSAPSIF